MSWAGKILRVDLNAGTCTTEPLNMEWAQDYMGQRGLATKYLVEETDPMVDPFSPDNKMIIATGPLTGTIAPTSGRWSVVCKSPLTGASPARTPVVFFGGEMKNAGWDMFIFEGKSENPVYLDITNDQAELKDASDLWGKSVWETETALRERRGDNDVRVASIGLAGEQGALYAAVVNDMDRAAGRSGVGAVMGSKKLKAIVVRGTVGVKVNDAMAMMKTSNAAKEILAENAVTGEGLPTHGTQVLMNVINELGALPTRNGHDVQFEGAQTSVQRRWLSRGKVTVRPTGLQRSMLQLPDLLSGRSKIDPSHFTVKGREKYQIVSGGWSRSSLGAGRACGVKDLDAVTFANFVCNEQGLDPITLGSTLGAAMDLYAAGAITSDDTGGQS
ncbi:MAG: hypothetical protein CM1200mP20_12610 [Pseudomonadota bacterium]|nr:MAG: hypothetical protein CM1200mP20_12610 [Pseudomonadota bacterium]